MLWRAPSLTNRGMLRGFFALCATGVWLTGCEAKLAQGDGSRPVVARTDTVTAAPAADTSVAAKPDLGAPAIEQTPSRGLALPWQTAPLTLQEIVAALPAEAIGTLSGEIYGEARPVRALTRTSCGAGTLLQAVYEADDGELHVTPGMALRFLGLETKKPVTYTEGEFAVTVDFDADNPELIDGTLEITYEEGGERKHFASLQVKGKPHFGLLEPNLPGEGELPLFEHCIPNGYLRVVEGDGTEHFGLVNATRAEKSGATLLRPLLADNAGLQIVIAQRDPKKPVTAPVQRTLVDARDVEPDQDVMVAVQAWWLPELAPPVEAGGINLGTEKVVQVREGTSSLTLTKPKGRWTLDLELSDLSIPILIDGPLRGKKLKTVQIMAWPSGPAAVPDRLGPPPQWWRQTE